MYKKIFNKQNRFIFNRSYIYVKDKDHQMSFKKHTNHLIPSSCACLLTSFSFSILFCNVNNNFKGFH
jgi:hypothetical protein